MENTRTWTLQELALRARRRRRIIYNAEQKRMIVECYLVDGMPAAELCKKFGIGRRTLSDWIEKLASGHDFCRKKSDVDKKPSTMPQHEIRLHETESEELIRLREENKRLSEALKMAEWSNHAKDVMIEEAEKTFKIPIRKKSGAKQ